MPTIEYSHKRPPEPAGGGAYSACPRIVFPEGIPDTNAEPIDDEGFELFPVASGDGTLAERLHGGPNGLAAKIATQIAPSRGFNVTADDVHLVP